LKKKPQIHLNELGEMDNTCEFTNCSPRLIFALKRNETGTGGLNHQIAPYFPNISHVHGKIAKIVKETGASNLPL
jgi:hypothetical protein